MEYIESVNVTRFDIPVLQRYSRLGLSTEYVRSLTAAGCINHPRVINNNLVRQFFNLVIHYLRLFLPPISTSVHGTW